MIGHALINSLKANRPAFGAWLTLPSPLVGRTIALASPHISWVCIDCEHGLTNLHSTSGSTLFETIASISPSPTSGPSTIVRIPATGFSSSTSWQIKLALDAGARGVMIPMVGTAEKAKEIVQDCRFPPVGRRGFGSPVTHTVWGVTAGEYLNTANDSVLVMVQIETKEGMQNVDAIAAVEGIDVLFIGPYDLSLSHSYPPPSPDPVPEVETLIQNIKAAAKKHGKYCAIYCSSAEQAARRAADGFDMINVTSDVGALTESIAKSFAVATGQQEPGSERLY